MVAPSKLVNSNFKSLIACAATLVFVAVWLIVRSLSQAPYHYIDATYGVLRPISAKAKPHYAIATFLSHDSSQDWDQSDAQNDFAFIGTRMLTYQLLYANETKLRDPSIQFIVLCTSTVSPAKRQQLVLDGATLVNVGVPPLPDYLSKDPFAIPILDHFSKLRLFALTQYDRILFLSPQTFLTAPVDSVFNDEALYFPSTTLTMPRPEQLKPDEAPLPANYLFAARSDAMLASPKDPYRHEYPPPLTPAFSPFAYLLAPSLELYAYLLSAAHSTGLKGVFSAFFDARYSRPLSRWSSCIGPDSALLNYAFRKGGTMPWTELDPRWSANWGNQGDLDEGVVSLAGEYWWSGDLGVRDVWVEWRGRMEAEFA